jgi:hypothetical protein
MNFEKKKSMDGSYLKSIARVLRTPLNASSPLFAVHVGPSLSHLELAYKETDRYAVHKAAGKNTPAHFGPACHVISSQGVYFEDIITHGRWRW